MVVKEVLWPSLEDSPLPGRLTDQVPLSGGSPSEHSGSGRPDSVLGLDNKSGKVRTETFSGVSVRGLRIPSRFSPCKTHSREMAQLQDLILRLKSKHVLTARCLMSLIGLLTSTEKMVPEGRLHKRPFPVSPQGALEHLSVQSTGDVLNHWTASFLGQMPFLHT